jgi:hypothetical protein
MFFKAEVFVEKRRIESLPKDGTSLYLEFKVNFTVKGTVLEYLPAIQFGNKIGTVV